MDLTVSLLIQGHNERVHYPSSFSALAVTTVSTKTFHRRQKHSIEGQRLVDRVEMGIREKCDFEVLHEAQVVWIGPWSAFTIGLLP